MKKYKVANDDMEIDMTDNYVAKENTVLIVDDSRFSRNVLKDILTSEGYEVLGEAGDGLQAIEMEKKLKPQFIFLDVEMPKLDGLGAIPAILENNPNAYIIMCTALGQKKIIVDAAKAGAKDYILKPYKKENIINVLNIIKSSKEKEKEKEKG